MVCCEILEVHDVCALVLLTEILVIRYSHIRDNSGCYQKLNIFTHIIFVAKFHPTH